MKREFFDKSLVGEHLGCFGNFRLDDPICKKFCALNLGCTVERDQNARLEILHDWVSPDNLSLKIQ
jgi:hypothetical protein